MLTIEENDTESVKVRLEAYKNRSDQELSIIFEGTGYMVGQGLVVDLPEGQVRLTPGITGFILDVNPALKTQWALDPYIYSSEYLLT